MTIQEQDVDLRQQLPAGRDLRTRYIPRARIRPVYLQAAPWLDLLFILFFLVFVQSRIVLRPGVVVDLPAYGGIGVQGGRIAVLVPASRAGQTGATLFLADEAFRLDDPARCQALDDLLTNLHTLDKGVPLTLYADRRVSQAYVMQVMDMVGKAGFDQLNIGTAPQPTVFP